MNRFTIYAFSMAMIWLVSCSKEKSPCFTAAGDVVTESRQVGTIRNVEIQDNVDLIITFDTNGYSLDVEAGSNLISAIKTEIRDEKLSITNENRCNWVRDFDTPFKVYLRIPRLDTLVYRSSGDVICTNTLYCDSIQVDLWEGAGNVQLNVNTGKSRFYVHEGTADLVVKGFSAVNFLSSKANGKADLSGFRTQYTYMYSSSPNHCYINVEQFLFVTIDNIGNVYYKGEPQISLQKNSVGELLKID